MDKDLEKLSALYDGELSSKEMQESLVEMNEDEDLKNTFQKFGLISDLVQRHSEQKTTKVFFLQDYLSKINPCNEQFSNSCGNCHDHINNFVSI